MTVCGANSLSIARRGTVIFDPFLKFLLITGQSPALARSASGRRNGRVKGARITVL
jgi:hypothetical protein